MAEETIATAEVDAPDISEVEGSQPEQTETQQSTQTPEKGTGGNDAARVRALLKAEKANPNIVHSDADLDLLERHYEGEIKLDEPAKPEPEEAEEESGEESETEDSEGDDEEEDAEPKAEKPKVSKEVEDAMKEVGAKTPEELVAKIKDLRKAVSGKDAQAVARLQSEVQTFKSQTEQAQAQIKGFQSLISDLRIGKPEAYDWLEKQANVRLPKPDPKALPFDEEADQLTGGALSKMYGQMSQLQELLDKQNSFHESERQRLQREAVARKAESQLLDEAVVVAQSITGLKDIPDLRNRIAKYVHDGKEDPTLNPIIDVIELANEKGVDIPTALLIQKGLDADLLIAKAKEEGRKSAYSKTPNNSLSGKTGGQGERMPTYTEDQLKAMAHDHTKIPDHWFDENDDIIPSKVPKSAWKFFGIK